METILQELQAAVLSVWDMLNEMSPYLLLGFLIAGIMHAFVPGKMYSRYLAGGNFRSVVNAALFGIPLPLCSCGVIPTAMSLRREGASKGAAVSFLVATPQTGVDSILASYSLLGLPFAILRPLAALSTALFAGQMVNVVEGNDATGVTAKVSDGENASTNIFNKVKSALHYAYVEMMGDIGKWLVIGIVIAGLIALIPNEYFAVFKDNTFASILLVLLLAIPMYLCATGSIPIAVALMLKGLTPGAALVMLMAGPASNVASMLVIGKVLGRRTLITYLSSIVGGAIAFALLIDDVLIDWVKAGMPALMQHDACCHENASWFAIACSILLICLLLYNLFLHFAHPHCHCGHDHDHDHGCSCGCGCDYDHDHCETTTVVVKGMDCSHCAASVKKAVETVEGVERVDVDLTSGNVTIEGDDVNMEEVRKAVESIGFRMTEK